MNARVAFEVYPCRCTCGGMEYINRWNRNSWFTRYLCSLDRRLYVAAEDPDGSFADCDGYSSHSSSLSTIHPTLDSELAYQLGLFDP